MEFKYVRINQLLAEKKIATVSPSIKLQTDDIISSGKTAVVSQDQEFIVGYTNLEDPKLIDVPFIVFGDHTEIFKYIDFPFAQGADGIKIIKTNDKYVDSKYLYYALKSCYYPTGFYQRHFKLLKRAYIPDLTLPHQKKLSSVLNNYDQLINKNINRIDALETMMYSLFKEWFIRFRFPGHLNFNKKESELGKIPNNFNILKANDVFDYYIGGGWGNDKSTDSFPIDAYVIRGTDFPYVSRNDVSTCPYRFHKKSNFTPRQLKENDIVLEISGGTAEQPVGRSIIITDLVVKQLKGKVICASFCKLIRPIYKNITPYYLYYWLKFFYDTRMIERFQLQSTGIINFKFEYYLKKGPIMVPPKPLMDKFEETIKPFRDEIEKLAQENILLQAQRDSLLPRLMSGKLSVEGKEIV